MNFTSETIVALATPPGAGAIGVIRLSGPDAIRIVNKSFKGKDLEKQDTHTLHFGRIVARKEAGFEQIIDEVVVSIYKGPKSYTGEDIAEVSCHGSGYILEQAIGLFISNGAVMAKPGEFTQRAFLHGKMDLTQAEAVADLIASESSAAQQTAMHNLRGGFSEDLKQMREELIQFSALIELELDFSQEDVEFADRTSLYELIDRASLHTQKLLSSFSLGNVIKKGVSVAIVGKPNAGKSTLLNALLNEERAIVSDIAGTTRDTIEETMNINGILFRFIDTAGIRSSKGDVIEDIGIQRSKDNAAKADVIIHLIDMTDDERDGMEWLSEYHGKTVHVHNKYDDAWSNYLNAKGIVVDLAAGIYISAKDGEGIDELKTLIYNKIVGGNIQADNTIITNSRHYAALKQVVDALHDVRMGLDSGLSGDLLALDIRRCLHFLGDITGEVTTEDKLDYIFSKFCIGK